MINSIGIRNAFSTLLFTAILSGMYAQEISWAIQGKITDTEGTPLIGATAQIENHPYGNSTDIDGSYSLEGSLPEGTYNLVFSYIGYSTKTRSITITSENNSFSEDAQLSEDFLKMDEVVITGTSGATAKKNLGNAVSTVAAEELEKTGATGIDQALSGKLPGALVNQNSGNPAGGISITLRGNSTVLGSSDPLYIIDGVIVDNSSLELLDLGGYTQNRLVDLNPADIENIEIIKGAAAAAIYGSRASNGVVQIFTKRGQTGAPTINFKTSFQVNQLRKAIEENMESMAFEEPGNSNNPNLIPTERYNMQDLIFRTGVGTNNNISVSGGSGNTRYYASASALYNEGIIDNSDFTRYTSRLSLDQVLNSWLSLSLGLGYTHNNSSEVPNGGLSEVYGALTGFNFNNNNYDPRPDADGNYTSPAGFVPNPLEVINTFDFAQKTNRFQGNVQLKATPFTGFSTELILGLDQYTQTGDGYIPVRSTVKPTGWIRSAIANKQLLNADLNLRYVFNPTGNLNSISQMGFTLQTDDLRTLIMTADKLSPVVNTTDAGTVISRGDNYSKRNIQGAFVQQTFGYDEKFFVTGAIRVDAASTFGIDERTQVYPKASLSYLISEDLNLTNSPISSLKLRASYGESGNLTALSAYERLSNYSPMPINGQTGLVPSARLGNSTLKPERQRELEFGIDAGFFNNRLGLEFSYYDVDVTDLLLLRTLAPSTGFETRLENVGNMTNKGVELLIRSQPVKTGDFEWTNSITFSSNRNKVDGIEGGQIALPKSFGVSVARNGEPLGVLDGFYYARNENGEILLDDDGLPTRAVNENGNIDRKTIGDPNPVWTGSFINNLSYQNWSFRFQLDAVQGFDVFNFTDRVNSHPNFGGGFRDAQEVRGELPRGYNLVAYNIWDRYIEDGSFVKIRELSLSYSITPKSALSRLTFSLIGRNIASFDSYSGWDPETSASGQTNGVRGFDFNEVPIPRSFIFSINAKF